MIVDSNALSAIAERDADVLKALENARRLVITFVSLGEFKYGLKQSRSRKSLEKWLLAFIDRAELIFADVDTTTFYAEVRTELKAKGRPIPANDLWIAALARQHKLPLLTRDHHFDHVDGIRCVSW